MVNLAILGHVTRGKEVIEILEMLGGRNVRNYACDLTDYAYSINGQGIIDWYIPHPNSPLVIYTLEEFLEKYPYKVGDKVKCWINGYCSINNIKSIQWDGITNEIKYKIQDYWYSTMNLQPYKEKTMKNKLEQITIDVPNGYEFFGIDDDNKIVLTKKQPQYPKTYEECCEVLMGKTDFQDYSLLLTKLSTKINEANSISPEPPHITLINNFYKLLICRDAYWKIADKRMGLDKPWEPDWTDNYQKKWIINLYQGATNLTSGPNVHFVLAFPTAEMRDAFYENFKELIESCREFL